MARLYKYVEQVHEMSRQQFSTAHPHAFLLQKRDQGSSEVGWTFKTQTVSVVTAKLARLAASEKIRISPKLAKFDAFPITKAGDNPWPERISVGRAGNNDVVLADSSVSKLHAHFNKSGKQQPSELLVIDAGSRNGTRINHDKIEAGTPTSLEIGDSITFGRATLWVVGAGQLYDFIMQHLVMAE